MSLIDSGTNCADYACVYVNDDMLNWLGTTIENPAALSSVLGFLHTFLSLASANRGGAITKPKPENATFARETTMNEYGYAILSTLLNGLLTTFPRDREIVRDVGKILYVAIDCVADGPGMLSRCVMELSLSSDEEKNGLCHGIRQAAAELDGGDNLKRVLNGFSNSYRRRAL